MALEIQKGRSKWWYGRVTVHGADVVKNLGIQIKGEPPNSLREQGDAVFERSRAKAQAALEKLQEDFKTRATSEELVQKIHEIRTGRRVRSIPMEDVMAKWTSLPRRRPLSDRYVKQAESWMKGFVGFLSKHYPTVREMADVQSEMAEAFFRAESKRGVAPKTYNNTLIFLRSCFHALRKAAGLPENPFEGMPTREEDTVFRQPFDAEELAAIVDAAKSDPFVNPIIVTGICTAMRRGDCCMLLKTAIDLPTRFIKVKTSKTGELVQIPIFPMLYDVLSKLEPNDSPYAFPEQAKKYQLNPDYITDHVRAVMKDAGFFDPEDAADEEEKKKSRGAIHQDRPHGLRKASIRDFHSLRVTWVTLALTAGVPVEIVQKVTGHRTAGIVMKHYFQPGKEAFRQTLTSKLPSLIAGEPQTKPLDPEELRTLLKEMKPKTWRKIRDELLSRLPPESVTGGKTT